MGTWWNLEHPFPPAAHIGYIVPDREAAIRSLADFAGIRAEAFACYDFRPLHAWTYGEPMKDCYMKLAVGVAPNGLRIELIEPVKASGTPHERFLAEGRRGVHHICYTVCDYAACRAFYASRPGTRITFEGEIEDDVRGWRRSFYAEDAAAGMTMEFYSNLR